MWLFLEAKPLFFLKITSLHPIYQVLFRRHMARQDKIIFYRFYLEQQQPTTWYNQLIIFKSLICLAILLHKINHVLHYCKDDIKALLGENGKAYQEEHRENSYKKRRKDSKNLGWKAESRLGNIRKSKGLETWRLRSNHRLQWEPKVFKAQDTGYQRLI